VKVELGEEGDDAVFPNTWKRLKRLATLSKESRKKASGLKKVKAKTPVLMLVLKAAGIAGALRATPETAPAAPPSATVSFQGQRGTEERFKDGETNLKLLFRRRR
jgi:hypothetical protein